MCLGGEVALWREREREQARATILYFQAQCFLAREFDRLALKFNAWMTMVSAAADATATAAAAEVTLANNAKEQEQEPM